MAEANPTDKARLEVESPKSKIQKRKANIGHKTDESPQKEKSTCLVTRAFTWETKGRVKIQSPKSSRKSKRKVLEPMSHIPPRFLLSLP
jgi:hypothetical protein